MFCSSTTPLPRTNSRDLFIIVDDNIFESDLGILANLVTHTLRTSPRSSRSDSLEDYWGRIVRAGSADEADKTGQRRKLSSPISSFSCHIYRVCSPLKPIPKTPSLDTYEGRPLDAQLLKTAKDAIHDKSPIAFDIADRFPVIFGASESPLIHDVIKNRERSPLDPFFRDLDIILKESAPFLYSIRNTSNTDGFGRVSGTAIPKPKSNFLIKASSLDTSKLENDLEYWKLACVCYVDDVVDYLKNNLTKALPLFLSSLDAETRMMPTLANALFDIEALASVENKTLWSHVLKGIDLRRIKIACARGSSHPVFAATTPEGLNILHRALKANDWASAFAVCQTTSSYHKSRDTNGKYPFQYAIESDCVEYILWMFADPDLYELLFINRATLFEPATLANSPNCEGLLSQYPQFIPASEEY